MWHAAYRFSYMLLFLYCKNLPPGVNNVALLDPLRSDQFSLFQVYTKYDTLCVFGLHFVGYYLLSSIIILKVHCTACIGTHD